jgi:3-oxoacyl-[acyl-carrier protein] reductase
MYQGETVLVTGASRGLGRQLCEHFLAHGGDVIGISRAPATLIHERYRHFEADIGDEPAVRRVFSAIRAEQRAVSILINNAGVATSQFTLLMPTASAEGMLRTNFLGAFVVARECGQLMLRRRYGRIINISSVTVPLGPLGGAIYSASKAALTQFTKVLARELASYNITCNVLGVSAIETDMWKDLSTDRLQSMIDSLPLKRPATLADVANVVDFFAHRASSAITGQVVYLGGVSP